MIFTFLFYSYVILIKNIIIEIKKKVEERRRKKVSCQTGVFDFQATDKNSTDKDNENRAESNKSNIISSNDLDSENFIENPKIINFNAVISSEAHDSNESVYMNTLVVYEEN